MFLYIFFNVFFSTKNIFFIFTKIIYTFPGVNYIFKKKCLNKYVFIMFSLCLLKNITIFLNNICFCNVFLMFVYIYTYTHRTGLTIKGNWRPAMDDWVFPFPEIFLLYLTKYDIFPPLPCKYQFALRSITKGPQWK